jgi:hypothetical protein
MCKRRVRNRTRHVTPQKRMLKSGYITLFQVRLFLVLFKVRSISSVLVLNTPCESAIQNTPNKSRPRRQLCFSARYDTPLGQVRFSRNHCYEKIAGLDNANTSPAEDSDKMKMNLSIDSQAITKGWRCRLLFSDAALAGLPSNSTGRHRN